MTTTTTTFPPLSAATYSVRLIFEEPVEAENYKGKSYFRLVCTVQASMNMPLEIFVHQRVPKNDPSSPYFDDFIGVCGPLDLNGLSSSTPDERGFIRKKEVDMLLSSVAYYSQVKADLTARVQQLCNALTSLESLNIDEVTVISSPATTTTTSAP